MNEKEKQQESTPVETSTEPGSPVEPTQEDRFNSELALKVDEIHKDVGACLDAVKELTKVTGELKTQVEMFRKAGKF